MRKLSGFQTRSDTNWPVQKLEISDLERRERYYQSSKNKGADQLRNYCEADQRLCFRIGKNLVMS